MTDAAHALKVFQTIHSALAEDAKTREPMNALIVWTELGKGLAGTLEQVGGERGLLRATIDRYCDERGAARDLDLSRWAYELEPRLRLGRIEAGLALRRIQAALEGALPELAAEGASDEGRKKLFLAVVRGWFPVGLDIFRALPAGRTAGEAELLGALEAWCDRFLPEDSGSPAELGVRVER